jgi:AcrR family transcriptional regulator
MFERKKKFVVKMVEEDKKKRILEAALNLFTEKGIDNTSTALISKEAGVAAGTIYLYFENKVDLINKLYLSIKEESMISSFLYLMEHSVGYESIEKVWMENVEWGVNNPNKFRFIMQFDLSPYHTKDTEAKIPNVGSKWLKLIEDGINNKIFADLPPQYIAEFFSAHFIFTVEYIIQTKTKERKIFFDTFFNGIKYTD